MIESSSGCGTRDCFIRVVYLMNSAGPQQTDFAQDEVRWKGKTNEKSRKESDNSC